MIWLNPVPGAGWYCNSTPVPVGIFFTQGIYVIATPTETQQALTLDQAMQIGHDMVLAQSAIIKGLSFRAFSIDNPADGQTVYIVAYSNAAISTGMFSLGAQTVTESVGGYVWAVTDLAGWSATG